MNKLLQLALLAAGALFLLPKLGISIPNPFAPAQPPAEPPVKPPKDVVTPARVIAATAIFQTRLKERAKAAGKTTANWWEWTWFYHNVLNGNTVEVIPSAEEYGVVSAAVTMTFEEFWAILQDGRARGIGADVPGLAGLRGFGP